jgi:phosphocarrier protein
MERRGNSPAGGGAGRAGGYPGLLDPDPEGDFASLYLIRSSTSFFYNDCNERMVDILEMKTFQLKNKLGMHARAAASFVRVAQKFRADIMIERNGQTVNGKSILGILTLACPMGGMITVRADGADAPQALAELEALIENKFGEE